MGDKFRKRQIENQRRGRALARSEAAQPRLIERPEVTTTIYHVELDEGSACATGDKLCAVLTDADGPVVVSREHERIGIIGGDGGRALKEALAERTGPGIVELRIIDVENVSGEARAELTGSHKQ